MRSLERAERHAGWAEPPGVVRLIADTLTITDGELRKVRHDPVELLTRAVQPILWLVVFGQVIAQTRAISTGSLSYLDYLAPGILTQSALFSAIFYGIAVIWERDLGVVHKILVTPAARASLVSGKALAGGLRALIQAAIIYVVSALIGVQLDLQPLAIAGVALVTVMGAGLFATFSLIIACLVRSRERFMGIGQLLTMPLFFASSAIYPIALMPDWLQVIARINPLTYQVDATRALMIEGALSANGVPLDILVLAVWATALLVIGSRLYARLAQ